MRITVFVQNEAGSNQKNYHNEKTLEYLSTKPVSRPYPYPYGFIVGTTARDGYNLDCFVITGQPLKTGQTVQCEVIGLMEQIEDGVEDQNILAVLGGETVEMTLEIERTLTEFVMNVFRHIEGKRMEVGRFLGAETAEACIASYHNPQETVPVDYCPSCSEALVSRQCKMVCPRCGFFLSCSDFY
ncbi:MAG: inorganic diphosphatase [Acidobacteria bacterium]|nr:inorganic diphosphatase [Acidobacteriota bacterium]